MSGPTAVATKPKIFVFVNGRAFTGDLFGCAIAEDGKALASHLSSSIWFVKRDMGLTPHCDWKHDHYAKHYPEGYELVDLTELTHEQLDAHAEFQAAIAVANAASEAPHPTPEAGE